MSLVDNTGFNVDEEAMIFLSWDSEMTVNDEGRNKDHKEWMFLCMKHMFFNTQ